MMPHFVECSSSCPFSVEWRNWFNDYLKSILCLVRVRPLCVVCVWIETNSNKQKPNWNQIKFLRFGRNVHTRKVSRLQKVFQRWNWTLLPCTYNRSIYCCCCCFFFGSVKCRIDMWPAHMSFVKKIFNLDSTHMDVPEVMLTHSFIYIFVVVALDFLFVWLLPIH